MTCCLTRRVLFCRTGQLALQLYIYISLLCFLLVSALFFQCLALQTEHVIYLIYLMEYSTFWTQRDWLFDILLPWGRGSVLRGTNVPYLPQERTKVLESEETEEKCVMKDRMQNETLKAAGQTQLLSSGFSLIWGQMAYHSYLELQDPLGAVIKYFL